jgi:hypothetical protein
MHAAMKNFPLGCLLIGLISLTGSARAIGPVDAVVQPVLLRDISDVSKMSIPISANPMPLRIKLVNDAEKCSGNLTLGEPSHLVVVPFELDNKQAKWLTVYCPVDYMTAMAPRGPSVKGTDSTTVQSVTVGLTANSPKSGLSTSTQILKYNDLETNLLMISSHAVDLRFLSSADVPAGAPGDSSKSAAMGLTSGRITPDEALTRGFVYRRFRYVMLGSGTKELSDPQISALKDYVAEGGCLVFSPSPNSAAIDSRWSTLLPAKGKSAFLGLGGAVLLSFDAESVSRYSVHDRHEFLSETSLSNEGGSPIGLRYDSGSQNSIASVGGVDSNPFKVSLPSFASVAAVLLGYFVLVVPFNIFVLKKLNRPELMWITAPIFAFAFAGFIFKASSKLGDTPANVAANASLISSPDLDHDVINASFSVFTPRAKSYGFNLRYAKFLENSDEDRPGISISTPAVVDTGFLQVPDYRSTNLQFRNFDEWQEPPRQALVQFSVGQPEDGIYPIIAKNVGPNTITDATFVAGLYQSVGREIKPGQSIKLMVDHVTPAPEEKYTEFGKNDSSQSSRYTKRASTLAQVRGQVALFGQVPNLPVGPELSGQCQYRSEVLLAAFAPRELKLP